MRQAGRFGSIVIIAAAVAGGAVFSPLALADNSARGNTTPTTQRLSPAEAAKLYPKAGETRLVESRGEIEKLLSNHGADLLVVNFWATWCGPCVEELPYFIRLANSHPTERVRVLGLSADFADQVETTVIPFLKSREVPYSNVVLWLDNPEDAISLVSDEWSGVLPATFFYDREGRKLKELPRVVTETELNDTVAELLKELDAKKTALAEQNP
jgi:thiol-disulfide isomerase/thioredoxin